ncbi:MAG: hypothetical protein AAGF84_01115 [Planctomycetota bacterium]
MAASPPTSPKFTPTSTRFSRPDARQRGSVLVLAVVLIVLLVMMGASYLQMARSDRRSSLQMDTRSQDFQDSILRYIGLTLAADVDFDAEFGDNPQTNATETTFFRRWGAERHDYPFTWSDDDSIQPGATAGVEVVFPVPPSARKGLLPQNAITFGPDRNQYDDPTITTPGTADDYFFAEGTGTGPDGRSAFDEDIKFQLFGTSGTGPMGIDLGQNDDMWLASTAPQFGGVRPDLATGVLATGEWPHLSNLTGVFIDLGVLDAENQPHVYISTADDDPNSGHSWLSLAAMQAELSNAPGTGANIRFADADGDGIADSRWTFAPVGGDSGLTYVMAVRIVDNSSKVNLNVASNYELTANSPNELARWYTPADQNIRRAFEDNLDTTLHPGGDTARTRLFANPAGSLFGVRDMGVRTTFATRTDNYLLINQSYGNPASVLPPDGSWEAVGSGLEQLADQAGYPTVVGGNTLLASTELVDSAYTGTPQPLSVINEAELSWRNGINRSTDGIAAAPADVESRTSANFWRDGETATAYDAAGFTTTAGITGIQRYFEENPRIRFTTISGSGDFDTLNINLAQTGSDLDPPVTTPNEIFEFLEDLNQPLIDGGFLRTRTDIDLSGNFEFLSRSDIGTWANFAEAATAFWSDWRDNDRGSEAYGTLVNTAQPELTRRGQYYGMEYLPFISEVYLKGRYELDRIDRFTGVAPFDQVMTDDGVTSADEMVWNYQNEYFLVIELVNPWDRPIPIADIELEITDGTLTDQFNNLRGRIVAQLGREYLDANEIVWLHVGSFAAADELDELGGIVPAGANRIELLATNRPTDWPVASGPNWTLGGGWTLTLSAPQNSGAAVPYQRFSVPEMPGTVVERYPSPIAPPLPEAGDDGFTRIAVIGTAAGLNMLTLHPDDLELQTNFVTEITGRDNTPTTAPSGATLQAVMEDGRATSLPLGPPSSDEIGNYDKGRISVDPSATLPYGGTDLDNRIPDVVEVSGNVTGTGVSYASSPLDEPFIIGNAGQFYQAADVFRVVYLGPKLVGGTDLTVAEVWRNQIEALINNGDTTRSASTEPFVLRDFMIDVDPRTSGIGVTNFLTQPSGTPGFPPASDPAHLQTTFPAFLLDRLSTFSPGDDNLDNDGDGQVDDLDERLVPGRINLNTVPANFLDNDLLAMVLPTGSVDPDIDERIQNSIRLARDYRDDPFNSWAAGPGSLFSRQASSRNAADHGMGIASMSHLMDIRVEAGDPTSRVVAARLRKDFNEYESDLGGSTVPTAVNTNNFNDDGYANDFEERLAFVGAMKQLFDVRSDVYTAYILVRGYPANDFRGNPIEEYTITATFDRSVVHESRPLPRLVSVSIRRQD